MDQSLCFILISLIFFTLQVEGMKNIQGDASIELSELPKPGEILIYDCRPLASHPSNGIRGNKIKCVQWNIERGYKLDDVIKCLIEHEADIICLQELDIGCERSGYRNCAAEIASALKMKLAFICEYEEYYSPLRSARVQGGGIHGNAIISKFDFEVRSFKHEHQPMDWDEEGPLVYEPRSGNRIVLVADIKVPWITLPIVCYCLHLEVFCGIIGRVLQIANVLEDAKKCSNEKPYQLIFGDLNTMAHGIARLCKLYCRDYLRIASIGYSEAAWWNEHIWSQVEQPHRSILNVNELKSVADSLVNPYFYDPFCVNKDVTLHGYHGLFQGKLDWTLLRGFNAINKGMDNIDYEWSDHRLLFVEVEIAEDEKDPGKAAYLRNFQTFDIPKWKRYLTPIAVTFMGLGIYLLCRGTK